MDLSAYLQQKREQIDIALDNILKDADQYGQSAQAMRYSLMAGGKRIRPILCLSAAEAVGAHHHNENMIAACSLEILHTYSLIHDDLPAMDNDVLRRGKPTCHVQYDEATAILAGDALLTLCFDLLSSVPVSNPEQAGKWLEIIQLISKAAGYKGMVRGQMQDLLNEGKTISLAALKTMHGLKTGALIEASVLTGCILSDGDIEQYKGLKAYAKHIGIAFQVADDILNVEGDPDLLGKSVGTDFDRNKSTYPALMGIENSKHFADELVNNALHAIKDFDNKADPLREIATYIVSRKR